MYWTFGFSTGFVDAVVARPICFVVSSHDLRHTRSRKSSKWCYAAKENAFILNAKPMLEIGEYGVANFLRQRESRFAPILAFDKNAAIIPVDVGKTKYRHIAGV